MTEPWIQRWRGRRAAQMGDRERNEDDRRAIRRITRLLDSRKKGGGERIWKGLDDKTIGPQIRLLPFRI